jgi:hypothetical protein
VGESFVCGNISIPDTGFELNKVGKAEQQQRTTKVKKSRIKKTKKKKKKVTKRTKIPKLIPPPVERRNSDR